jgi:hypothetical protein
MNGEIMMTGIKSVGVASLFAATSLLTFVAPVQATLIGDTITSTGISLGPGSATIGAGVEFNASGNDLRFDFGANTLTISDPSINSFSHFGDFVFAGFNDAITSVSIASNTGFTGSIVNHFIFDAHSLRLDVDSFTVLNPGNSILVFNITQENAAVPEAATLALIGLGLTALAYTRRRRLSGIGI